ncbi:MAG: RdgB/HAM1 family non-canonical purine NTP pyrophosphatase [Legionellaceae bacterium]|nr:RdgB/HAM1 family non-canonical purine NTP pyrophosphatase [Legionellaceae bacterium]
MKDSIILATSNPGKIKEFRALLSPRACIPQKDLNISDADETGHTFIENALLKARHASHISNMPAMADDSGLVIPALQGKPGIYSSRFAGLHATDEENITHVLDLLQDSFEQDTPIDAFFYSAIVFIQHEDDPTPLVGTGRMDGYIISSPRGTNGFGYDPIFYLPEQGCTLAQVSADIKNTLSHRACALQALSRQYHH